MDEQTSQLKDFFAKNIDRFKHGYKPEEWADQFKLTIENARKMEANERQSNEAKQKALIHLNQAIEELEKLHRKFNGTNQSKGLQRVV